MAGTAWERYGEVARRIYPAKEHVGNGITRLLSSVPLHQDGRQVFLLPRQGEGFAGHQYQDYRRACLIHGLYQGGLPARQRQVGQVKAFPAVDRMVVAGQ